MFKEGNILYFEPFYFENGNTPKPKYFLVLKEVDNQLILASLPTSHDHIPSNMSKVHGNGIFPIHRMKIKHPMNS